MTRRIFYLFGHRDFFPTTDIQKYRPSGRFGRPATLPSFINWH